MLEIDSSDSDFSLDDVKRMKDEKDVEGLIEVLKHVRNNEVRMEAAWALADMGEPAVEPLIQALKNED